VRSFENGETIARAGERLTHCCLMVQGFTIRQKTVSDKNQILAIHVPGDMPDLYSLLLPAHENVTQILERSRSLTNALWRETLVDASIYREWVANLARDGTARVAHLICEFLARLEIVGLAHDNVFKVPFTQVHLAEACGQTSVHINRTLKGLRHRGLLSWQGHLVKVLDRKEPERVADFDPRYLLQKFSVAVLNDR
jgi:CRP-like cAMP-binding protein